eukprot:XP_011618975.1 PREDICTED: uncharacterized protein LOC105419234 [Takifugu rubripes]
MAGVRLSRVTLAFTLVLCTWVKSSTCFGLHWLDKNGQDTGVGGRRGKFVFDSKDLGPQLKSSSATGKLLKIILGMWGQTSENEASPKKEAAWKQLKPSLHCGQNEMVFRATGYRAAEIQLDMGAAAPLPLNHLPETCGYTRKHGVGFVLVVPYDGCNVTQENGNYVLKMRWLNASVEFICSMTSSSKFLDLNELQSSQESEPLPVRILRHNRHRRAATGGLSSYPHSFYYNYACLLRYYMYMMSMAHFSNTQTTTTTAPPAQTTTAKPLGDDRQIVVYYPQFFPYYYPVGQKPVDFLPSSDCDSSSSTGQRPQCSQGPQEKWPLSRPTHLDNPLLLKQILQRYYGLDPDQALPQTTSSGKPHDPTPQNTSPTPATVTRTPCPNQERPIGASCLGEVSTYIPYEHLSFPPHISYENDKPVGDKQNIPEQSYNRHVGLQPRVHPYQWAGDWWH